MIQRRIIGGCVGLWIAEDLAAVSALCALQIILISGKLPFSVQWPRSYTIHHQDWPSRSWNSQKWNWDIFWSPGAISRGLALLSPPGRINNGLAQINNYIRLSTQYNKITNIKQNIMFYGRHISLVWTILGPGLPMVYPTCKFYGAVVV